ncbi:MAG: hypothetical protein KGQ60_04220 [Planctomycetes bacterium]|nr:hypothetical protein [Planctomycetota bacterium]
MIRKLKRRCLSPLKKLGGKIKKTAERFVIKTINKNPDAICHPGVTPSNPAVGSMDTDMISMLLPLLRSQRKQAMCQTLPFSPIVISPNRILTPHPEVGFFYLDANDLHMLGNVAMGIFQDDITETIVEQFYGAQSILHLNAGVGYHTLTLHRVVQGARIVAVESIDATRELLQINIDAHNAETVSISSGLNCDSLLGTRSEAPASHVLIDPDRTISLQWRDALQTHLQAFPMTKLFVGSARSGIRELDALTMTERFVRRSA